MVMFMYVCYVRGKCTTQCNVVSKERKRTQVQVFHVVCVCVQTSKTKEVDMHTPTTSAHFKEPTRHYEA